MTTVRREVQRRRGEELRRSLAHPHVEASELADAEFEEWGSQSHLKDSQVLDAAAGKPIRWVRGKGWVEPKR